MKVVALDSPAVVISSTGIATEAVRAAGRDRLVAILTLDIFEESIGGTDCGVGVVLGFSSGMATKVFFRVHSGSVKFVYNIAGLSRF